MPSGSGDISVVVGDGSRRMTYAELAAVRAISVQSARRLVLRHRWPKQIGNDGFVRILVPLSALSPVRDDTTTPDDTTTSVTATSQRHEVDPEPESWGELLLRQAWEPTLLYRHYDAQGVLLYVGSISLDIVNRLDAHRKKPDSWYRQISRILVENFATRIEARQAERAAILAEKPLYNDRTRLRVVPDELPSIPVLQPFGDAEILHRQHGTIEVVPVRRVTPTSGETRAIDLLREELAKAHDRAGRTERQLEDARRQIEEARQRIEDLRVQLTDATSASLFNSDSAVTLRRQLDQLKAHRLPWWRRWLG
jgi:hypothetical protein